MLKSDFGLPIPDAAVPPGADMDPPLFTADLSRTGAVWSLAMAVEFTPPPARGIHRWFVNIRGAVLEDEVAAIAQSVTTDFPPDFLTAGEALRLVVACRDGAGLVGRVSDTEILAQLPPVFLGAPVITGTGTVNQPLGFIDAAVSGEPAPEVTRNWRRDGAVIEGATGTTFTPRPDDVGTGITGQNVARNLAGGLERIVESEFTNRITIIAAAGDYVRVTNRADLQTELNRAPQGRIIECDENRYIGTVTGRAKRFGQRVTVVAANRAAPPIFTGTGFSLSGWSGLNFDGLRFENEARDSRGDQAGKCLSISGCSDMTVIDSYFKNGHETIRADNCSNMEYAYLTQEECGMDAMRLYGRQTNVWVHHNKFFNFRVNESRVGDPTRHPDAGAQFAVNGNDAPPDGVLIENNFVEDLQPGHSAHGFFFGNNAVRSPTTGQRPGLGRPLAQSGYKNLVIRYNYLHLGHIQAICLEGVRGATVEGNCMRGIPGVTSGGRQPSIYFLWDKFEGPIIVRNNVTPSGRGVRTSDLGDARSQVTITDHVMSNSAWPEGWAETDIGRHLANPGNPRVGANAERG